ncbi:MAG: transposase, partial [Ignavibacteriaceae bacterium]
QTAKRRKENAQRNHIEGKFGQGKNAYGLSRIRARRQDTSESWIAAIFFVMNLVRLTKTAKFFFFFVSTWENVQQALNKLSNRDELPNCKMPQAALGWIN